ncbi:MAG: DotA/TraY family protein [Enterobacterales bacterium]|nr:DotA/TraY family protein [Enterobacterales bacterium]
MGSHDLILRILDMLFGTWSSAFFTNSGSGNISILAELLSGVNILAMLFAAIITGLFAFGGTVNAAVKGTFFGEGWSGASTIVSVTLALSMVMPVNLGMLSKDSNYQGQVSGAQLLVLKLAVAGSDVADALYKKTVLFFTKQGISSSTTIGHLNPVLDLVEANLCTLAAIDTWEEDVTNEKILSGGRHKKANRPFKNLYAIRYSANSVTKTIPFASYDEFTKALSNINKAEEKLVSLNDQPPEKVKVYANQILFGGEDHVCGVIAIPTIDLKDTKNRQKKLSKTAKNVTSRDLNEIKLDLRIQAYKKIRKNIVKLVEDTHDNAVKILYQSLKQGNKGKAAAQFFSNSLNNTSDSNISIKKTVAIPIANDIYTSGVTFFNSISNHSIAFDNNTKKTITNLMLEKGWIHAGIWGLEISRMGSILAELKSKVVEIHLTNRANNVCATDSLLTDIIDTFNSWVGVEKTCDSNIFLMTSWPAFKRFTISSITDGNIKSSIGAEKYFARSARVMQDNQCGIKGQESSACQQSSASSVSYANHLMVNYIWDEPEKYGLSNPQEPLTYINSIGQRMLGSIGILKLVWVFADGTVNALDKNAIGPLVWMFSYIASALKPLVTGLMLVIIAFLSFGYILSYVLPILPVIHWIMGILSWIITILLAYIALPFALVLAVTPSQGGILQKKSKIIQILIEVILSPTIKLFALFAAIALAKVSLALFNEIFWRAIGIQSIRNSLDSVGGVLSNLFEPFALLIIASTSMILIFRYSFSVMHTIPRRIFQTLSMSGATFGDQYSDDPYNELSPNADSFSAAMSEHIGTNESENKKE